MKSIKISDWDIWSRCTAAPAAILSAKQSGLTYKKDSSSGKEGTVAHHLLECSLLMNLEPREFMEETVEIEGETFEFTPEICEETNGVYWRINDYRDQGSLLWTEQQIIVPQLFNKKGYVDVIVLSGDRKSLHIFDFKFGAWKFVNVKKNGQLMLYLIGVLQWLAEQGFNVDDLTIETHILQPRMNNIASEVVTPEMFDSFMRELQEVVFEILDEKKRKFLPGDHCYFCPINKRCKALINSVFSHVADREDYEAFDYDSYKNPALFTDQELINIWPHLEFISAWAKGMKNFMDEEAAKSPNRFSPLKLIRGKRGSKSWRDEEAAEQYCKSKLKIKDEKLFNRTLKTPTQVINFIGSKNLKDKEDFHKLYNQTEGRLTLTHEDDPREGYMDEIKQQFLDNDD